MMGIVVLLVLYGIMVTTLGGYRSDDYMRVHTVFSPLLTLIIWGSVLQFFCYLPSLVTQWRRLTIFTQAEVGLPLPKQEKMQDDNSMTK